MKSCFIRRTRERNDCYYGYDKHILLILFISIYCQFRNLLFCEVYNIYDQTFTINQIKSIISYIIIPKKTRLWNLNFIFAIQEIF